MTNPKHESASRTDDQKAGICLIAGSLGGILTMAMHPIGRASLTPEVVARLAVAAGAAHALAIASVLTMFLGACGLAARMEAPDRISFAALIVFGFACIAIAIAATVSGFIIPAIWKGMVRDVPANTTPWHIATAAIFQINQAFARVYSVAASGAIILWSIAAIRHGHMGRRVAIYGCIVSPVIIVAVAIGHLQLDVHGMTAVWLGQAIWFMVAGAELYRSKAASR
jgi:hypothetical protein